MRQLYFALPAALALGACATSDNPADGGFFSGIKGVAGGGFQARVDDKEAQVSEGQARQAELEAELAGLRGEYSRLRAQIVQQRSRVAAAGTPVPQNVEDAVATVVNSDPEAGAADNSAKLAQLKEAILGARQLADELAELG